MRTIDILGFGLFVILLFWYFGNTEGFGVVDGLALVFAAALFLYAFIRHRRLRAAEALLPQDNTDHSARE